ncbi:MAG: PD-(D/E)XK nuclease family protein [Candidatus Aenigmatarchaeota archaeon]
MKINPKRGESFHQEHYKLLDTKSKKDKAALRLSEFKKGSREAIIEPTLYSPELRIIGQPDIIFFHKDSAKIIELKSKRFEKASPLDEIQVQAYMLMLNHEDTKILRNNNPSSCVKKNHKKVHGFVLYRDGKINPVFLNDGELIKTKASKLLEDLIIYKSIDDLPEPSSCNEYCINFRHCTKRKGGYNYENTFAGSGRFEIERPAYHARV